MRLIDVDATKFRCRYDKVCSCDNKDKCKIIIPSEEVINDNLIMIMKSITKINKLTNESKIKLKTPMVF